MKNLWRRSISLNYGDMRIMAAGYVLLPVALFFIGFLRWYYALIGMAALGISFYCFIKFRKANILKPHVIELRLSTLIGLFGLMLLWCQLGGLNGYGYQSSDFDCRNAIFRDIITHRWPVFYETSNSALVYYIGHWLPPALIGKLADLLFHNARFTWFAGRMALWVWTALGLTILLLLLFLYTKASTPKKRIITTIVLIFFSGLDFFGAWSYDALEKLLAPDELHLEWWARVDSQFSSITTCLYWVFNQSVTPWIVTACFMMDENESNYLAYGIGCILCGPLSLVGLALLMFVRAISRLILSCKEHCIKDWFKAIFSLGNTALLIIAFPFLLVYLFGNNAIGVASESEAVLNQGSFFSLSYWSQERWYFFFIEIGFYVMLLWHAHKKDPIFYAVVLSLLCIPYFHIGVGQDFCMRASIPGLFIVMMYTAKYLVQYLPGRKQASDHKKNGRKICAVLLLMVFLCGALTPCVEIFRGIYHVATQKTYQLAKDSIVTFDTDSVTTNFSTSNADQQFFFKYLAR